MTIQATSNMIALDEDQRYAPRCYLICRVTGKPGNYDWSIHTSVLVQSDWDFPPTARAFGWTGEDADIEGAIDFLDANIGKVAEDHMDYFAS